MLHGNNSGFRRTSFALQRLCLGGASSFPAYTNEGRNRFVVATCWKRRRYQLGMLIRLLLRYVENKRKAAEAACELGWQAWRQAPLPGRKRGDKKSRNKNAEEEDKLTCGPIFDGVLQPGAAIVPPLHATIEGRSATVRDTGTFSGLLCRIVSISYDDHAEAGCVLFAEARLVAELHQSR